MFYLWRQGTQAGEEVSAALGGLASSPPLLCTAHTPIWGWGHCLPPKLLIWKQVSRAPRKAKGKILLSWPPQQDHHWWGHAGVCPLLPSEGWGLGSTPNQHPQLTTSKSCQEAVPLQLCSLTAYKAQHSRSQVIRTGGRALPRHHQPCLTAEDRGPPAP